MGIMDKIEQKLSGNNNQTEEERRLEQEQSGQWERGAHEKYNSPQTSHVQHPMGSETGRSGIVGGTHPAVTAPPGAFPQDNTSNISSTGNTLGSTTAGTAGLGNTATGIPSHRDPTDTRYGGSTNANPLSNTTGIHHVSPTTTTTTTTGTTTGNTSLNHPTVTGHNTGLTSSNRDGIVGGTTGNSGLNSNDYARSGIVGGTAVTGGLGSEALNRHHDHTGVSSTSDKLRDTHLGGTTGTTDTTGLGNPTTGNTYSASHNRGAAGDIGSRRDADHPDVVRRTAGGGVSNGGTDFISGPQHRVENPEAIPTAGGHKVGGVGEEYNTSRNQHHLGRDAAVAGGAGAAGYGAYEATHSGSGPGPAPNTSGPHRSDMMNKLDPRVTADPSKRDDTLAGDRHGTTTGSTTSGIPGTTGTTTSTGIPGTTSSHHDTTGIDRRHAGTYGQDISSSNRPNADTPLTSSKDFNDRHTGAGVGTAAGVGAGAGALAAGSHHHDHHHNSSHLGGSGLPSTTSSSSQRAAGVDREDIGSQLAKRMGGAYEAGYRDGYRDALEKERRI